MRHIPLLAEEGRLRHQENAAKPRRRRRRARSASAIARSRNSGQFGWPSKGCRTNHPVRDKSDRIHFLMSRTPLLCEEGNVRPKTLSKKLKVAAWLHKQTQTIKNRQFCGFLWLLFFGVSFALNSDRDWRPKMRTDIARRKF